MASQQSGASSSAAAATERERPPAIQVICLGSGGGPSEDNVSGFLVRSAASGWVRGSILAVDAGSHLAAITRILENHLPLVSRDHLPKDSDGSIYSQQPLSPGNPTHPASSPPSSPVMRALPKLEPIVLESGPFAGVPLPHASARANSLHIVRSHVATYLISHPHLDHLSGFAINTAAFHATSRPKTLAALPFTVEAIKRHIFNDVIWPNLTDEDGGVGFVTFQRLKEGGDVMVGEGDGRGYIEVCEGLGAKGFKISHGKCMRPGATESHRGSISTVSDGPNGFSTTPKGYSDGRHHSLSHLHLPGTPGSFHSTAHAATSHPYQQDHNTMAVDSTAYFIRDLATSREVLMFGDVEPDSISVAPRMARVWAEAAPKVVSGTLSGIFLECSYPDSQLDALLFGHLAPRHLVAELQTLADMVREERSNRANERALRKRKRGLNGSVNLRDGDDLEKKRSRSLAGRTVNYSYRRSSVPDDVLSNSPTSAPHTSVPVDDMPSEHIKHRRNPTASEISSPMTALPISHEPPLQGLRVIIMHVKDTMQDGPHVSELILDQLNAHAAQFAANKMPLGCVFEISESGKDYWF